MGEETVTTTNTASAMLPLAPPPAIQRFTQADLVRFIGDALKEAGIPEMREALASLAKAPKPAATAAAPVVGAVIARMGVEAGPRIEVEREERGMKVARFLRAMMVSGKNQPLALEFALRNYGEGDPVTKALAATDFAQGGSLVATEISSDFIELLREKAVVRQLGPVGLPMDTGKLSINKQTGGSTAGYIGENQNLPKTGPTTGTLELTAKKLGALVPVSMDLIRRTGTQADTIIRNDLVQAVALRGDLAMIRGQGTQYTPKGLRYWAPTANVTAANATVNLDNVTTDIGKLKLFLRRGLSNMIRPGWLMAPGAHNYLFNVRVANGPFAYREELRGGTLDGYPFGVTTQIPENLGGGNESEFYFVDFNDFIIGETTTMILDASTEAAYDDNGTVVSTYSKDQMVVRAILEHDFGMRHDASVALLTGVTWS